jgi:hypothetical protein
VLQQLAQREPQILDPVLDEAHSTNVATGLHVLRDGAHAAPARQASLFQGQAGGEALLDLAFQVVPQLFFELALDSVSPEQRPEAKANLCEPARHVVSSPVPVRPRSQSRRWRSRDVPTARLPSRAPSAPPA